MPRPREFEEDEVVGKALRSFWERGYASTSTRDLAEATGVLPGSLHQAFGGKHQLFLVAMDRYIDGALAAIRKELVGDGPRLDRIRDCLLYVAGEGDPKSRARGCLVANAAAELAPHDGEVTARVRRMFDGMEALFAAALREAQQRGEIGREKDVKALARTLVVVIEGLRLYGKAQPRGSHLHDIVETTVFMCR
jgi:TetR/AcrR family transcriptional regulator, transcriptional repressor for nem operon